MTTVLAKFRVSFLAAGVATWRLWKKLGGTEPAAMAGHSLGEYTALVCAGAIEFPEAVGLVKVRAELMQNAVPATEGAMASQATRLMARAGRAPHTANDSLSRCPCAARLPSSATTSSETPRPGRRAAPMHVRAGHAS